MLFLFLFSINLFAQNSKREKIIPMFGTGYMWQGTHNIDFGLGPTLLLDARKDHSNIGLLISGNLIFYNGVTYFTPITKLRIMPRKRKKFTHLAWFASVGHSYTNIQNKYDHRVTPELGIKWEWCNLSIGFNIPTSTYRDNITQLLRVAFSLNLF